MRAAPNRKHSKENYLPFLLARRAPKFRPAPGIFMRIFQSQRETRAPFARGLSFNDILSAIRGKFIGKREHAVTSINILRNDAPPARMRYWIFRRRQFFI